MKNLIEAIRKENNIKQETLANAVGVSRQTIVSIEQGKCTPSVAIAIRIAKFFNMSVEEIFLEDSPHFWISEPNSNKNYIANSKLPVTYDYIFSQNFYSEFTYGNFPLSFNGGEIIAVYNALMLSGKHIPLAKIIFEFEENCLAILGGLAGTDPKKIGIYLAAHNIKYQTVTSENELKEKLSDGEKIFIYSYFDLKCPLGLRALHTVAGVSQNKKLKIYNLNNDESFSEFSSFSQLKKGKRLIIGYIL